MLSRRGFIGGLLATPAIIAASHLMPIRGIIMPLRHQVVAMNGTISAIYTAYETEENIEIGDMLVLHHNGLVGRATTEAIRGSQPFVGVAVDDANKPLFSARAFNAGGFGMHPSIETYIGPARIISSTVIG